MINVVRVQKEDALWNRLIHYAEHCSWAAGKHLAAMLRENSFREWESVFAALLGFFVLGQVPDLYSVIGYVIIIGVAVWSFVRNRKAEVTSESK